jgi:proteasome lid subunit RPN8/RPN11
MPDATGPRISTAATRASRVTVPRTVLHTTVTGLRERSAGWRESACVWIGTAAGVVQRVTFHHQIANDRATALSLELPETAKFELYRQLAREKLRILALLHTHPESWVGLSWIDQQNQISSRVGFLSIVLPFYGKHDWNYDDIGFHVKCDQGWRRIHAREASEAVRIT